MVRLALRCSRDTCSVQSYQKILQSKMTLRKVAQFGNCIVFCLRSGDVSPKTA